MFELFMLLGFALAAFSQLLPANPRMRQNHELEQRELIPRQKVRCDPPGGVHPLRRCAAQSDSFRPAVRPRYSLRH